ncbi:MAG: multifunctional oxoglutarate decarboxylase/oxoglutarate dehydrogenase thiamine pyrophosphate-binding subunit/dihydrolipoyllysine-residue succinyltransferase subunit [Ilumatobacteraceae bacterium]
MTSTENASRPGGPQDFGANSWLVDEMYGQYVSDPESVSESWREFFSDYRGAGTQVANGTTASATDAPNPPASPSAHSSVAPSEPAAASAPPSSPAASSTAPTATPSGSAATTAQTAAPAATVAPVVEIGEPIRGAGVAIAANMERSLGVPTATSFRNVPAKLLEVNRKVINGYRSRSGQGKVSFTHLIGYAIVRAIVDAVPGMNNTYAEGADGKPRLVRNDHVNMGLAVDVAKADGSRTLVVPVLRDADTLDFAGFLAAYEDLIRKVKSNKLAVADFQGATITLTNPGTIGTVQSVPRLMPGQGVIVGVGSIDYPAEFQGADEVALGSFGISKVVTVTSTYDHRIIQGAESGMFLKRVHELMLGDHGFYEDVFQSLGVPYEAVKWRPDVNPVNREEAMLHKQMQVATLIRVHRVRGHLIADLDPLRWRQPELPAELDPATYGLTIWDLDREFLTGGVGGIDRMTLGELLGVLRDAYCRTIGVEYMHIQNTEEQRWIQAKLEGVPFELSKDDKYRILERLNSAEAFEKFLATKYVGTKRFGLEGAESAIPILDAVLSMAADHGIEGTVLGMAHRGRLNVLANVMGKSYDQIFKEFEGHVDPSSVQGSGDVKYHLGASGKYESPSGKSVKIELAANPSHLETVDPIVMGMVRAQQDQIEPPNSFPVLSLLIHGDAAFAGQGIVAECLAMSDISGYRVGGTVHLIINNQIGFTTSPQYARSSLYCSDVAKTVQAPIFHVNGDDPEACVRVARLAFEYRQQFHKDVVIDMVCYRRHGHNEGDDPSYTQPLMYKAIAERRSVRKLYVEQLVKRRHHPRRGRGRAERLPVEVAGGTRPDPGARARAGEGARPPAPRGVLPHVVTGVERPTLDAIFGQLTSYPDGFTVHPKLGRQFATRAKQYAETGMVDWATAEAFAFGSLLIEGHPVRLAGEDCRRGTFSHRHAALVDYENEQLFIPLQHLPGKEAEFWVYDSLLSEYAALGYEYGYAHTNRDASCCGRHSSATS